MNDPMEILAKLGELALMFPEKEIPQETLALYARHLDDLPVGNVCAAIERLINTARFFPRLSEIREAVILGAYDVDLAEEGWVEVQREVVRVGFNRPPLFHHGQFEPPAKPEFSSPLIAAAVQSVGWDVICTTDKPEVTRSQFCRTFTALKERELRAKQAGVKPFIDDQVQRITTPDGAHAFPLPKGPTNAAS